jgi:hypothetical protein
MDSVNDELQRRINAHVLNGDAPSIIWAMEGQIRINTELEAKLAELERREALLTNVVRDVYRWSEHVYGAGNAEGWYEVAMTRIQELRGSLDALTDAGFPWTEEPQP